MRMRMRMRMYYLVRVSQEADILGDLPCAETGVCSPHLRLEKGLKWRGVSFTYLEKEHVYDDENEHIPGVKEQHFLPGFRW